MVENDGAELVPIDTPCVCRKLISLKTKLFMARMRCISVTITLVEVDWFWLESKLCLRASSPSSLGMLV